MWKIHPFLIGTPMAFLIVLTIVIYGYLPKVALQKINDRLQEIPGYEGKVESLAIQPFRPAITLRHVKVAKDEKVAPGVFVEAEHIRVAFSWLNLLRRRWVVNVTLHKPNVLMLFSPRPVGQKVVAGVWQPLFAKMPPFRMDHLTLSEALFHIRNDEEIPPLDLRLEKINATATNLANRASLRTPSPSQLDASMQVRGHAPARLAMMIHPFEEHVTFDITGTLKELQMTSLNPSLRHYMGLEFTEGLFDMAIDIKVHKGEFRGKVHRTIRGLTTKKNYKGIIKDIRAEIMQFWVNVKEDHPHEQMEKTFEFSGPLGLYDQDVALAGVWIVKGAFIQAIRGNIKDGVRLETPEKMIADWAIFQANERKKTRRPA
jgi:hypothetical protein